MEFKNWEKCERQLQREGQGVQLQMKYILSSRIEIGDVFGGQTLPQTEAYAELCVISRSCTRSIMIIENRVVSEIEPTV